MSGLAGWPCSYLGYDWYVFNNSKLLAYHYANCADGTLHWVYASSSNESLAVQFNIYNNIPIDLQGDPSFVIDFYHD